MTLPRATLCLALFVAISWAYEEVHMKRPYGRPLNPYSWMNRQVKSKRDVDGEMEMMPSEIKRDQILRNPYSWLARKQREAKRAPWMEPENESFLASLFPGQIKKSRFSSFYPQARPVRNPYSWMNFV